MTQGKPRALMYLPQEPSGMGRVPGSCALGRCVAARVWAGKWEKLQALELLRAGLGHEPSLPGRSQEGVGPNGRKDFLRLQPFLWS
jgi:hypothetical protein